MAYSSTVLNFSIDYESQNMMKDCSVLHIFNSINNAAELNALIRRFPSFSIQHIVWEMMGFAICRQYL